MAMALADEPQGWRAHLELTFARRNGITVLARNRHTGPLRVQRPLYPEGGGCHAYVLHPPGGVVGGDRLEIDARVADGAAALITTPGATKFYRSNGETAVQQSCLDVAPNARLEWLPQETILYPGADAAMATRVELAPGGAFIGWEILCIGLPACGQTFGDGRLATSLTVRRAGRLLFKDRLRIAAQGELARPAGLRGFSVCATMIATGCAPEMTAPLREIAADDPRMLTGITLMGELMVVRCLGNDSAGIKALFGRLWRHLRPALFGCEASAPRIWEA